MSLSFDDFIRVLISQMTEEERRGGIAYAAEGVLPAGSIIQFTDIRIEVSTDSYLGFIDREPQANWGHSARYIVVDQKSGGTSSLEARLPPFKSGGLPWRVVYKAPTVPDIFTEHPT